MEANNRNAPEFSLHTLYYFKTRFATGASYNIHHCTPYETVFFHHLLQKGFLDIGIFAFTFNHRRKMSFLSVYSHIILVPAGTSNSLFPKVCNEFGKSPFCFDAPLSSNLVQCTMKLESLVSFDHFRALSAPLPTPAWNYILFYFYFYM